MMAGCALVSGFTMLPEIAFVTLQDVRRLIDGLSAEDKEALLAEQLKQLPADARSRVLGLSESGLTVVTGSFVSLNSDVAINIQNTSGGFDPEAVFRALADYRKSERSDNNKTC
jgi:hypothetical protein